MSVVVGVRALLAAACLVWLAGCESAIKSSSIFVRPVGSPEATNAAATDAAPAATDAQAADLTAADAKSPDVTIVDAKAPEAKPTEVTGTTYVPIPREPPPGNLGPGTGTEDPLDDLWMGKRQFHEEHYGLAEEHFRRVVEHENVPAQRKAEAWIGLAHPTTGSSASTSPTAPIRPPSPSSAARRRFSTTRASPTCCAATMTAPAPGSPRRWQRTRTTRTSRTTSSFRTRACAVPAASRRDDAKSQK